MHTSASPTAVKTRIILSLLGGLTIAAYHYHTATIERWGDDFQTVQRLEELVSQDPYAEAKVWRPPASDAVVASHSVGTTSANPFDHSSEADGASTTADPFSKYFPPKDSPSPDTLRLCAVWDKKVEALKELVQSDENYKIGCARILLSFGENLGITWPTFAQERVLDWPAAFRRESYARKPFIVYSEEKQRLVVLAQSAGYFISIALVIWFAILGVTMAIERLRMIPIDRGWNRLLIVLSAIYVLSVGAAVVSEKRAINIFEQFDTVPKNHQFWEWSPPRWSPMDHLSDSRLSLKAEVVALIVLIPPLALFGLVHSSLWIYRGFKQS